MMTAVARRRWPATPAWRPGRPVGGTYYLYRTLRNLDLDGVMRRLMDQARAGAPRSRASRRRRPAGRSPPWRSAWLRDEYQSRIDKLRQEIENEIRRRLVADRGQRGPGQVAAQAAARGHRRHARHPGRAGGAAQVRSSPCPASWPCGWPASAATAARARSTSGPRCATRLSTGGVPVEPRFRYPRPVQARDRRHRRHLGIGGLASPASPSTWSTPSAPSSPRCAASCSSTASTR